MDKDQEIEQLKAALQEAMQTIAQLRQQVQDLEARLAKDSHNSHLPPSSDRFARHPKSLRKKSGKPTGGQKGHPGHHLQMVETPDQVLVRSPESCSFCQQSLTEEPIEQVVRRQVFDVSMPQLCVTEYQLQSKRCPWCQALTLASCPAQVSAPVQYGPRVAALAVYLSQVQLLPDQRICQLLFEGMGLPVSSGSIHQWIARCARALQPVEEAIKSALRAAPVLHQDETGLYERGQRRWMHVCSTPLLTHYAVHPKRGREAMDAIGIAPAFTGISVHDGWESYQGYSCSHALCNVHHLRELTFVEETYHQGWASDLKALLLEMKHTCEQAREAGQTMVDPTVHTRLVTRYETLIQQGLAANPPDPGPVEGKRGRPRQHPARCLPMRLHTHQEQVLAFLHHLNVPFSNSQAERDIRMVKVQQKVSGCFRSEEGARLFCRIRGYVSTMQKQGSALLSLLEAALSLALLFSRHSSPLLSSYKNSSISITCMLYSSMSQGR